MEVTQVYEILNEVSKELLGEETIVKEDLSNVVDIGATFENAKALDNYLHKLHDVIGKMVFRERKYSGRAPSVLMSDWDYGSILRKITAKMPEAAENESWELQDGASYDPNIFTSPHVESKCFNKRVTFEIPTSFTEHQVKSAFHSPIELNALFSLIETTIENSRTIKTDALIMRTINNMMAETIYNEYKGAALNSKSGIRAVNVLYLYNQQFEKQLTAAQAIYDPDFLRFAALVIRKYVKRLNVASTLFNIGCTEKFTGRDNLHVVMLSDFMDGADVYLQSDTFHDEMTALPNADSVAFWQGSGTSFDFADASSIDVKTASNNSVAASGIICTMFDKEALGVSNINYRIPTHYNERAEFWNKWYKWDAGYFNDLNENMVVFFIA